MHSCSSSSDKASPPSAIDPRRTTLQKERNLCSRKFFEIKGKQAIGRFGSCSEFVSFLECKQQIGFPVISGNPFFIPKSEIQTSIPIPPVTGENRTQPGTSQSKNLHRVEESSHQQASQHPKTSSHWRKLDATKHLTVQIPPVTGTYDPLRHLPESVLFQRMEESPR